MSVFVYLFTVFIWEDTWYFLFYNYVKTKFALDTIYGVLE